MAFDNKIVHAQEFTDIERQTLRVWFDVDQAGNDQLADQVLNAGLMFEHYTSLLDSDPDLRTTGQLAEQNKLAFLLSEQLSLAESFLQELAHKGYKRASAFRASVVAGLPTGE